MLTVISQQEARDTKLPPNAMRVVRRNSFSMITILMDLSGDLWELQSYLAVTCGDYIVTDKKMIRIELDKRLKVPSLPKGKRVKGIYQPSAEEVLQYNWWKNR